MPGLSFLNVFSVLIFLFAIPFFNRNLKFSNLNFPLSSLHNLVVKVPPLVPKPTPEEAKMNLNVLALPGTAIFRHSIFLATLVGLLVMLYAYVIPGIVTL